MKFSKICDVLFRHCQEFFMIFLSEFSQSGFKWIQICRLQTNFLFIFILHNESICYLFRALFNIFGIIPSTLRPVTGWTAIILSIKALQLWYKVWTEPLAMIGLKAETLPQLQWVMRISFYYVRLIMSHSSKILVWTYYLRCGRHFTLITFYRSSY